MTREEAKALLPIIQAYAEGKTIQTKMKTDSTALTETWIDIINPDLDGNPGCYRIKPQSKYRPFKSAEECWKEMQKHQPFGWVRYKMKPIVIRSIASLYDTEIEPYDACTSSYKEALEIFTFADGEPFGVKEE